MFINRFVQNVSRFTDSIERFEQLEEFFRRKIRFGLFVTKVYGSGEFVQRLEIGFPFLLFPKFEAMRCGKHEDETYGRGWKNLGRMDHELLPFIFVSPNDEVSLEVYLVVLRTLFRERNDLEIYWHPIIGLL